MEISKAMTRVAEWLERNHVPMVRNNDKELISGILPLCDSQNPEYFIVDFREELTIGYSYWRLPEGYDRPKLVEFMALLNYTLLRGNFEFDEENSVLRYKYLMLNHSIEYGDDDVIGSLIVLPCVMMSRYRSRFQSVFSGEDVNDVMEMVRKERN